MTTGGAGEKGFLEGVLIALAWSGRSRKQMHRTAETSPEAEAGFTELFQNLPEEGLAKSQEASVQDLTAFCACV